MDFVNQNYLISCQCLNSVIKHALGYYMHLKMCWPRSHSPGASRQFIVDGSQLQAMLRTRPGLRQMLIKVCLLLLRFATVHSRCSSDSTTVCLGKPWFRPGHRRQSPVFLRRVKKYDGSPGVTTVAYK